MNVKVATGKMKRTIAFRLRPGTDVMEALAEVCEKEGIKNGVIVSCLGSLRSARVFNPEPKADAKIGFGYGNPIEFAGPIELVSATGMICHGDDGQVLLHVHASLSDQQGNAFGGHLIPGNKVLITVDVIINEIEGIDMIRKYDEETEIPIFHPEQL